jgi:acetyltransferase-like isoleucine patch superfamily enzyme
MKLDVMQKRWREANSHNGTRLTRKCCYEKISVGRHTYGDLNVYDWGAENEALRIGHFVSIAEDVTFVLGGNHMTSGVSTYPFRVKFLGEAREATSKGPIVIRDDVWIGLKVIILSGVTVGQGAVVAAGSVVSRDVPSYSVFGGNPGRVLKYRFSDEIREELECFDFGKLSDTAIKQFAQFLSDPVDLAGLRIKLRELKDFCDSSGVGGSEPIKPVKRSVKIFLSGLVSYLIRRLKD